MTYSLPRAYAEFCGRFILSGDIELNPGLYSVDGSADVSDILSSTSFDSLANHLSILYLNIQSILPTIDLIRGEATSYDILIFSESWLYRDREPEDREPVLVINIVKISL